jgi:DHA1 family multidrug resistance protein-like MFS transporter
VASWLARRLRFGPLKPWQRQQYIVVATVALAQVAFDLTQPFMPLYIRDDLGVTDVGDAAFWSGLVVGAGPLFGSIMGPVWGMMADRFGRKPMVLRALIMIAVMQTAIAFAPDVHWLLAFRVIMGLFAGFTPMAMALAISVSPREKMAQAIGLVQAAQLAPTAIGPTIGGVLSDAFGLRVNFILTGAILLIPISMLFLLVNESEYGAAARREGAGREGANAGPRGSMLALLTLPGFMVALGIVFLARFTDRSLPPILPLYLVELETPAAQLATITGFIVAVGAVAAATSSMLYGRWARPETTRRLLLIGLAGGAVFSLLLSLAGSWQAVAVYRIVLGLLAGGIMSLAFTIGAQMVPRARSGLTFSVLSSCGQLGGALSPMLACIIGQLDLRYALMTNAGAYVLAFTLAAVAAQRQPAAPAAGEPPARPVADAARE